MRQNLLTKLRIAAIALAATIGGGSADAATTQTLTPSEWTQIQASGNDVDKSNDVLYQADATAYFSDYAEINSDGTFKNMCSATITVEGTKVVIAKFDASATLTGQRLIKATLRYTAKCTVSKKKSNVQVALIGTNWTAATATWNNTNTADIMKAEFLADLGSVSTTAKELTLDVTEKLNADDDNVIAFGIYTATGREQQISNMALDLEYVDASNAADYKVQFVDEAGTKLRDDVTYTSTPNTAITLTDADKAPIYNADRTAKYMYKSDDAEGKTIAADGSTVVTVTFRAAEQWAYTLNATNGDGALGTAKTGTNFEMEQFNLGYPTYFLKDGALWQAGKYNGDKKGYYLAFNLDQNNKSQDVSYPTKAKENIVYYCEAENIAGLTAATNGNTAIRSSNGGSAYAATEDVAFTTLPAGKYKLTVGICDAKTGAGSQWSFRAGDTNIFNFTATTINYVEGTSEEFEIAEPTQIYLCKGGNANQAVDFIFIEKTAEHVAIAADGLATFCPAVGVDFTGNTDVAAYKAAAEGDKVLLTKVNKVAAGEGVVVRSLNGNAVAANVAVDATATANEGNQLVGVQTAIASLASEAEGKKNYILNTIDGNTAFYAANGKAVAAGRAYLQLDATNAAKSLTISFDDEADGIAEIGTEAKSADAAIYNLRGQRVANPAKGLYIQNGKKVIIK